MSLLRALRRSAGSPRLAEPSTIVVVLVMLAILVAGTALRLRAVPSRFGPDECADGDVYRYYVSVADSLLEGRGWTTDYEWNFIPPPGQAAFIALARLMLPGTDYGTLRYLQALISALTILLAYWVGLRMGGRWAALAAATFLAFAPDVIRYVAVLLAETNFFFLLFLFLAVVLEGARRKSVAWMAAAGCALALASLTKSFPMFLALVLPFYLIARGRDRLALRQALGFVIGFTLLISPWLIRNAVRYDHLYMISTNAGTLLAQSNFLALDAADQDQVYWEQIYRTDEWKSAEIEARFAGRVDRHGRPEWNEKDRAYMKYALGYMTGHPAHFLRNYVVKLGNVLIFPLPGPGEAWRPSQLYRLTLVLVGLVGLAWFVVAERREPRWILVPIAAYFLFFSALLHIVRSGRINLPLKLLLALFAAYLLGRLAAGAAGRLKSVAGPPARAEGRRVADPG